jgi:uncharacterized protein (DUF433 family)/DNA-binding transcriptional MerR regulator
MLALAGRTFRMTAGPAGSTTFLGVTVESDRGAYDTRRAAALSGVPASTLNYWARTRFYEPSVAPGPRDRLWSWNDLVALRLFDWLRRPKGAEEYGKTPTQKIREALDEIREMGFPQGEVHWAITIDAAGRIYVVTGAGGAVRATPGRQAAMEGVLDLVKPYKDAAPDLLEPRPLLRILPGKLHGEPHILRTRIPSEAVYGLHKEGYSLPEIAEMFPGASSEGFQQAIEFERGLERRRAA